MAKPPQKDPVAALEESALGDIKAAAEDAKEAAEIESAMAKALCAEDARFLGAKVRKVFSDGTLKGTVKRHVVLPNMKDEDDDGERWLISFENGKEQLVRPQELLDILVGDEGGAAVQKEDPLANDPLIGRKLRAPEADDEDVGTILSVTLKKPQGAKKKAKRVRHYYVEWRDPQGELTLTREYVRAEVAPYLI